MSIYDTLNDKQKEAVEYTEGPLLILAGAGSGKTRVLTHRVAWLIDELGVNPWNIMAITFTNKAAGEMRDRVDQIVGYGSESIWVSTFHSSCVRFLRRHSDRIGYDTNFTIYDTDDQKNIMKEVCKKLQIDTKHLKEKAILSVISSAKNELISPEQFMKEVYGDFQQKRIAEAYIAYQDMLRKNNAFDFDDLIMKAVELFRENPDVLESYQRRFRYIMVDEYQDTNTAQFELIRLLAGGSRNLCVVGDDDQSIYKFRGANIRNILDFESVYPDAKVIKLEQNYRSRGRILDAANAVISHNVGRKQKSLWTDKGEGEKIHFIQFDTAYEEADFIIKDIRRRVEETGADRGRSEGYDKFAILYRTNAQSRLLEERAIFAGIPYNVVGGTNFYSRREIKDILAYLKTIDNGKDDLAVKRIINVPKRGIGATTIAKIQDYADLHEISFFEALQETDKITTIGRSGVKIEPFVTQMLAFRTKAKEYGLGRLLQDVLDTTGYLKELQESDEEDAEDRIENIDELLNKIIDYEDSTEEPTLSGFLEEVALVADIDSVDGSDEKVLMMTLHSAKGLEFEHVYLAGMEDGVFPSYMTITGDDPSEIEEERRLAYVGITRAMEELTITCAKQRMLRGETQYNLVSRFVREIPEDLLDHKLPSKKHPEWEGASFARTAQTASGYQTQTRQVYSSSDESTTQVGAGSPRYAAVLPRAISKPKATATEVKPYLLKSVQANTQTTAKAGTTSSGLAYVVGDRVKHMKFGEGTVLNIDPGPRDYQVTVAFDQAGTKIMYAGFAKLQKI